MNIQRLKYFIPKVLNRVKLIKYVNLKIKVRFRRSVFNVPLFGKTGYGLLQIDEDFDYRVYRKFSYEIGQGTFLDIGANVGQTILKVKEVNPQTTIVSVEPNVHLAAYLNDLIQANKWKNVLVLPLAIGNSFEIGKLFRKNNYDTGASLEFDLRPNYFPEEAYSLVTIVEGKNVAALEIFAQPVTFVKIDVEGGELNVLKGIENIVSLWKPIIYCEVLDSHNASVLDRDKVVKENLFEFVSKELGYDVFAFNEDLEIYKISSFSHRVFSYDYFDFNNYLFLPNKER